MTADRLFVSIESDVFEAIQQNAELASPEAFKGRVLLWIEPQEGDPVIAEFAPSAGVLTESIWHIQKD